MSPAGTSALGRLVGGCAQQRLLAAAVPVAVTAFLAAATAAGAGLAVWPVAVTVLLAVLAAAAPGSAAPLVLLLWLGGYWLLGVAGPVSPWTVLAAAAVLVVHVASGLAAHGPAGLVLDRATLVRWLRRGVAVGVATLLVWVVCAALARGGPPGGRLLSGTALAVVALVAAAAARRTGSVPR